MISPVRTGTSGTYSERLAERFREQAKGIPSITPLKLAVEELQSMMMAYTQAIRLLERDTRG